LEENLGWIDVLGILIEEVGLLQLKDSVVWGSRLCTFMNCTVAFTYD
jgi:hypothetical protein